MPAKKMSNPELRTIAILLIMQLRGDAVTTAGLEEANEAADELNQFVSIWEAAKHAPEPSVDEHDVKWLELAAEKIARRA